MATTRLNCKKCGPLTPDDVAWVTDYDQAAGTIIDWRQCLQCDGPATRGA